MHLRRDKKFRKRKMCRECKKRPALARMNTMNNRKGMVGLHPKYVKKKGHDLCQKCWRAQGDRERFVKRGDRFLD